MSEATTPKIRLPIPHAWEVSYGEPAKHRCFKTDQAEADKAAASLHGTLKRLYSEEQVLELLGEATAQPQNTHGE